jgi:hypothetical protein
MNRRKFSTEIIFALSPGMLAALGSAAHAASLQDLTEKEASQGLKAALEKGATVAVGLLGQTDGFLGNEKVRIPLPGFLEDAAKLLRKLGQGKRVDELVTGMNRAAEAAVPQAKELLVSAVSSMNVSDAKNILTGGDTSVTTFFSEKTRSPLFTRFLPIVTQSIEQIGLVEKYNQVAGKAAGFGLVKKDDAKLQDYVTNKTLDGLYTMIAEEERKIRSNPIGAGSALLQKVFGALK